MVKKDSKIISPFLGVYRPQYSSIFSIFERITGIFILINIIFCLLSQYLGVVYCSYYSVYFLLFSMLREDSFVLDGCLVFILFNIFYHLVFGFRFLYWDRTGGVCQYGLNLKVLYKTAELGLLVVCVLTVLCCILLKL